MLSHSIAVAVLWRVTQVYRQSIPNLKMERTGRAGDEEKQPWTLTRGLPAAEAGGKDAPRGSDRRLEGIGARGGEGLGSSRELAKKGLKVSKGNTLQKLRSLMTVTCGELID